MTQERDGRPHLLFEAHPDAWDALAPLIRTKVYHKDDMLLHHGDAANNLWLVNSGWVKLTRQTPDGNETIIGLCTEGDIFGEAALFAHANYPYHVQVVGSDASLTAVPSEAIRALLAKDSVLAASIMALLNMRVAQAQLKLEHMTTMSASQRLGCFLLRLCHSHADGKKILQIPIEKHVLAAYLGMKPETFSRSQQQLKPLGIEVSGHSIAINNISRLREFVCGSCSESGSCESEAAAD